MIQIFKKVDEMNWQLIEEMQDESLLVGKLADLRQDGNEYRAEKKNDFGASILEL